MLNGKLDFDLACFSHFKAFGKVYRLKRQLLWQQSVTTILSNVPSSSLLVVVAHTNVWYHNTLSCCQHYSSFFANEKDIGKDREMVAERMNYWILWAIHMFKFVEYRCSILSVVYPTKIYYWQRMIYLLLLIEQYLFDNRRI